VFFETLHWDIIHSESSVLAHHFQVFARFDASKEKEGRRDGLILKDSAGQ
jgi:hypothetical protein